MRWMLIISPIAGMAQFLRGRMMRGALMFAAWIIALNGLLILGPALMPETTAIAVRAVSFCLLAAATSISVIDVLRHSHPTRIDHFTSKRERLLATGIAAYLKNDLDAALDAMDEMVRMDIDDADARIYLAMTYKARGNNAMARRQFRKCRSLNRKKWGWEIDRALAPAEETHT